MAIMQAHQLKATVRANTEQYERALREIDAALQAPVERQFQIERRIAAILATIAQLKIEQGTELPVLAAEQIIEREEDQEFVRDQQAAVAQELVLLGEEMVSLQKQVHATILEVRQALAADTAYNEVKQRQQAEADEVEQKVAAIRPALEKCNAVAARYASSRVYAYLLSVGYGTPEYSARGRAWLGDLVFSVICRFAHAQRNAQSLAALQSDLEAIKGPAELRHAELQNWLHSMEAAAGKSAGMDQLLDRINEVGEEVQQRKLQTSQLSEEMAAYEARTDAFYVQAHRMVTEYLYSQDEDQVLRAIKRLPGDAAAAAAAEWAMLKHELRGLRSRYAASFARHTETRKQRERAKALEYRVETACGEDVAGFRPALQINKLIDRFMAGTLSEEAVVQEIRRAQVASHSESA